jgi:uncharacterized protein
MLGPLSSAQRRCYGLLSFCRQNVPVARSNSSRINLPLIQHSLSQQYHQQQQSPPFTSTTKRCLSDWTGAGTDLLQDSLEFSKRPKIVLEAYAPTGFDVKNAIQKVDKDMDDKSSGQMHMEGSIMVFPHSCFLWNLPSASEVSLESLSPILLYRPSIKYLFIGCNTDIPQQQLERIKVEFREEHNIIVEKLDLAHAMGTFNILNGEDRSVAAALIVDNGEK